MNDLRQALYLIADEMRGMATLGDRFAANVYERERSHRLMELAADVAALAEDEPRETVRALFEARPWFRASPALGVDALVQNPAGEILLIQRKDSAHWALPGGIAEIGSTAAEAALRELWEEAGLRGTTTRLLGIFDNRNWGTWSKVHMWHLVFAVSCSDFAAVPGIECLDARFFAPNALPEQMHGSHGPRLQQCLLALRDDTTYIDPADTLTGPLPMAQRPTSEQEG